MLPNCLTIIWLLEWINGEEALKSAIVKSLGKVVRQVMRCAIDGFTLMTI
jgi:hypothetical protein